MVTDAALDDVVEETSDGEGTDAAGGGGESRKVGAGADLIGEVAFEDTVFAGGASIDNGSAGFDHGIRD